MATATATLTVTNTWSDGQREHVIGTIAISAASDVYVTGGLALSLKDFKIKSTRSPLWIDIKGLAPGFRYRYVASSGKIMLWSMDDDAETDNNEAIDATVSGDTIDFYGIFKQLV